MHTIEPPANEAAFFFCVRLARIKRYVQQHYAEPITLGQAADIAGLEKGYFSKYFHDRTGIYFKDWIAFERITRAVLMLTDHDHNITDLAFAVGFQDLRTFERAFKRFVGITPRECRSIVRRHKVAGRAGPPLRWEEIAPTQ